jgi:hypothetical protein
MEELVPCADDLGVADALEDLPPSFRQIIKDNVAQSFNDALENPMPAAFQLNIQETITAALTTALPPLLAPMRDSLTRMETKMERMETKLESVETKLTQVGITQAKVSIPMQNFCVIHPC